MGMSLSHSQAEVNLPVSWYTGIGSMPTMTFAHRGSTTEIGDESSGAFIAAVVDKRGGGY